jgi:hypothetical protein
LLDFGNSGGSTDQYDFVNVAFFEFGVFENLKRLVQRRNEGEEKKSVREGRTKRERRD